MKALKTKQRQSSKMLNLISDFVHFANIFLFQKIHKCNLLFLSMEGIHGDSIKGTVYKQTKATYVCELKLYKNRRL